MTPTSEEAEVVEGKYRALWLAAGAVVIVVVPAALFIVNGGPAAWVGAVGALLVSFGVFAPFRGGVSAGVLVMAVASLVATTDMGLAYSLVANAFFAVAYIAALVLADLSFAARRATVMSPVTIQGFAMVHLVTSALGVVAAAATLGVVLAVDWPEWLVVVPAVALAGAAVVLTRLVRRYRAGVNVVPQPPPPAGSPSQGLPPPSSPKASRNLRTNMPQPPPPRSPAAGPVAIQPRPPPRPRPPPPPPPPTRNGWPSSETDHYQW